MSGSSTSPPLSDVSEGGLPLGVQGVGEFMENYKVFRESV